MKLIANAVNGNYLKSCLPTKEDLKEYEIDYVMAAIAYGDLGYGKNLIDETVKLGLRLDIWMRSDHTVPVEITLLEEFLKSKRKNVFCNLVPDKLHSKVIWWKGYGAYIGSANLSGNAWNSNIEAGVFFDQDSLVSEGLEGEIEGFFEVLRNLERSFALTEEYIEEQRRIQKARAGVADIGKPERTIPYWEGLTSYSKIDKKQLQKQRFKKEWDETLTIMRGIEEKLESLKPDWIDPSVPTAWVVDQFLHAFYYHRLGDGRGKPVEESFELNRKNPSGAVDVELSWWASQEKEDFDHEYAVLHNDAPLLKELCAKDSIKNLSKEDFVEIVHRTHATLAHVRQMKLMTMGLDSKAYMSHDERVRVFTSWVYGLRNKKGQDIRELIYYVLYGGGEIWERIFNAGKVSEYQIYHFGINSIAELAGWVSPDQTFPRNRRTSKALRALGYDVRVL